MKSDFVGEIYGGCLGARVRMVSRAVSRVFDEALRPLGVQLPQFNILAVIAHEQPIAAADVARRLSLEKSTLSRNLRTLEAKGWVESRPGELRATPAGRRLLRRAHPAWQAAQEVATELLGASAADALRRAADRLPEDS